MLDIRGGGDEVMFASILKEVIKITKKCFIETEERAHDLFVQSFPNAIIFCKGQQPWSENNIKVDFHCWIRELSPYFYKDHRNFPKQNQYLKLEQKNIPSALPQLLCAIALSFGSTIAGGWMSFSSVAIPKMMMNITDDLEEEDNIQIDLHTGSWIASLFFFGNIIGCLLGGFVNQRIGARRAYLCSAPLVCLTWAMIALSHSVWMILVSRVISGVVFGVFQANGKVYNAEIAHPDMRGSLGTIMSNMFALGSIYTYLTGYFVTSWRVVAWLQMLPACLLGISVLFIPDSPYWLVERGREEEARRSLSKLRGRSYDIEEEFLEIVNKKRAKQKRGRSVSQTLFSRV